MPRHLPLIQSRDDDDGPPRPTWQWTLIGTAFAVSIWIPLGMLAALASAAWVRSLGDTDRVSQVGAVLVPHVAAFAFACASAGMLVGRFGAGVGRRHGALAGLGAAFFGAAMSLARGSSPVWALLAFIVLAVLGGGWTALGAAAGRRLRMAPRVLPPSPSSPKGARPSAKG